MQLPPLSALRAFAAYVDTGSVQRAGEALNVSHPAISQQIRKLEDHLGLTLLDRSGRSATLTPEGRRLSEALTDGFGRIAERVSELTGAEAARPLHISTTPAFAANWLMPRVPEFRARHPEIDLMIDPNPALNDPVPGGLDLAIRYGAGTWDGFETELLERSGMAVVGAPSLIGDAVIDEPEQLRSFPWLQELGTTEATVWLTRHGVEAPDRGGMYLPGNLALDAARNGQGILVTARLWVQEDVRAGRLRVLFEDSAENGYFIVTAPGVSRPALRDFRRWLRRQATGGDET
ncbi:LysR family transcriptional regulator [Cribrihabitans marinus]|nr:LysR family transcriptional regulator [Cribrihabitans marinus]